MFELLNTILAKNTGVRDLVIVALFAFSWYQGQETNQLVKETSYQYEYKLISYALKDINSNDEVVAMVRKWQSEKWGAQIAATEILCEGPGKEKLISLMGSSGASTLCRISH